MLFANFNNGWSLNQLFTPKEDWEPNINELPREFRARINAFCKKLGALFYSKRGATNLTRHQE